MQLKVIVHALPALVIMACVGTAMPEPTPAIVPFPAATQVPVPTATPRPLRAPTAIPSATGALWRGLVVAPEERCAPYDSSDYRYPQTVEAEIIKRLGGIYGPYTGTWFGSPKDTDIEHIVARSEAHDSGLCAADEATRKRFARDLLNLTLASPSVNRSQKRANDVAEWLPVLNQCWFASQVVKVRLTYGLTIDQAEADAIDKVLDGCNSTVMKFTVEPSR